MFILHSLSRPATLSTIAAAIGIAALAVAGVHAWQAPASGRLVFIGTYTGGTTNSKGIYAFRFDETTGALTPLGLKAETRSPSFLAASPDGRVLYAVNEIGDYNGAKAGSLTSYTVDPKTGTLTPLGVESTGGSDPCHVQCDRTGKVVAVANYSGGKFVFTSNEMASTVTTLTWDGAKGALAMLGSQSTLPEGFKGNSSTAEIQVHPNGRFLYGSNRGHDSIAVFSIAADGSLKPVEHESTRGKTPRHFTLDPTGRWLIAGNQGSGTLSVFAVDQSTGALTPSGPLAEVGSPVCVLFWPR